MKKPIITWDEESGSASFTIVAPDGTLHTGLAICSPDDILFKSEKIGLEIAERRATIKYLTHIRDNVIKPELNALTKFFNVVNQSKKYYNPEDYTNQMLMRAIERNQKLLSEIKEEIHSLKDDLKTYINDKEEFHKHVISYRKAKSQ